MSFFILFRSPRLFISFTAAIFFFKIINSQNNGAAALLYYVDPNGSHLQQHMCRSRGSTTLNQRKGRPYPGKDISYCTLISLARNLLISFSDWEPDIRILVHQISYEDVQKIFQLDPRGITDKILNVWGFPIFVRPPETTDYRFHRSELEVSSLPKYHEIVNVFGKIYGAVEPGEFLRTI